MRRVGDWKKALTITSEMTDRFRRATTQALLKEAHQLRGHMVKGVTSGAPGGQTFKPLSPLTLALRRLAGARGTKPLIRTGNLRRSISVVDVGGPVVGGRVFVGVHRSAKRKDGRAAVRIAEIHEFGAEFTMTPKMRRFLFAILNRYGAREAGGRDARGRFTKGKLAGGGGGGTPGRIRIPARPFVRPTVEAHAKPDEVKRRFWANVSRGMGYQLGRG